MNNALIFAGNGIQNHLSHKFTTVELHPFQCYIRIEVSRRVRKC